MQNKTKPPFPPLMVLIVGMMAASTSSVMIRFAQQEADSLVISAVRLTLAVLILLPVAFTRYRVEVKQVKGWELFFSFIAGALLALHFATWITSLHYTSVASSVVLVASTPLWVALLSPILLKESLPRAVMIGMIVALVGGGMVGLSNACQVSLEGIKCADLSAFYMGNAFYGNILAVAGAITGAGYLMVGRKLSGKYPLVVYILYVYGSAAVVLLLWVLLANLPLVGYSPQTYLLFVALALIPQLLGHSSFNWSLKYLPVAYVSVVLLAEPIGSTSLAYFILNEQPTLMEVMGGAVILAGIYIASKSPASTS